MREKSPEIDCILTALTGKSRNVQIGQNKCMTCESPDMYFRTELDVMEYRISGMCQSCQDSVFGKDTD